MIPQRRPPRFRHETELPMSTTLPCSAGAVSGGELSHSFARSREASSD